MIQSGQVLTMINLGVSAMDIVYAVMEFHAEKAFETKRGLAIFPGWTATVWHDFFYHLVKQHPETALPSIIGEFDWDGPYPTNRALDDLMRFMCHWCANVREGVILWTKRSENPLLKIPRLHEVVMLEAERFPNLISYHRLPF